MAAFVAGDPTDITTWVNFGVLGLVVLSLITGWLWPRPSVDRLVQERERAIVERDRAEAQRDAMALVLQEKLLPVVTDFVATTRALLPVLQEIQQLQQMIPILQHLIDQESGGASGEPLRRPPPKRPTRT